MNDPVWSVIIMVLLSVLMAFYAIWAILSEAYAENDSEEQDV